MAKPDVVMVQNVNLPDRLANVNAEKYAATGKALPQHHAVLPEDSS